MAERILRSGFREFVGSSASTLALKLEIQKLKGSRANVLVHGESGTGKELVARAIHQIEENPARPFYTINCGALPEALVESELFGHVRGAFTGADKDKKGLFELANGGDLFLDEIGDLPLNAQVKLLRALQDGTFRPVGSNEDRRSFVRIIAATHRDLAKRVEDGRFRADLFYRLNVVRLHTTPLRQRKPEIPELARFFVELAARRIAGTAPRITISRAGAESLLGFEWPGNVRELQNSIERAVLAVHGQGRVRIEREDLLFLEGTPAVPTRPGLPGQESELSGPALSNYLKEAEAAYLQSALALCGGSIPRTADRLGLARSTLYQRLRAVGLGAGPGLRTELAPRRGRPPKLRLENEVPSHE